jgi:hypothetical protein
MFGAPKKSPGIYDPEEYRLFENSDFLGSGQADGLSTPQKIGCFVLDNG